MSDFKYNLGQEIYIKGEIVSREESLLENRYRIKDVKGNFYLVLEEDIVPVESPKGTLFKPEIKSSNSTPDITRPIQEITENNSILLTINEAAELAGGGLKASKIRELTHKKDFYPVIRIGKRLFIHRLQWIQWLNEQAQKPTK